MQFALLTKLSLPLFQYLLIAVLYCIILVFFIFFLRIEERIIGNFCFCFCSCVACGSTGITPATETTVLGFVCFIITLVCCQPTELILGFFLFHKFSNLLPPPPRSSLFLTLRLSPFHFHFHLHLVIFVLQITFFIYWIFIAMYLVTSSEPTYSKVCGKTRGLPKN